jgi:hypothetical protein
MYLTGLAKLEYRPEAEFMSQFVAACLAMRFKGFKPQELSNVINGELMCTAKARVAVGWIDVTPVHDRPGEAGVQA